MGQMSTLVQEALTRKSAGQTKISAKRWAAVVVAVVAFLVYALREDSGCGGPTQRQSWWWTRLVVFVVALMILCKLLSSYVASYLKLSPIEVTDKQRSLLNIGETDLGFKPATPKKASSTPVVDKSVSLSALFGATLRTPAPLSSPGGVTPVSMSGGAWANLSSRSLSPSSPLHGSPSPLHHTSIHSHASSSASPGINLSMSSSGGGSVTANSWAFHNQSSILDSSYNAMNSPQRHLFSPSQLSESLLASNRSPVSPSSLGPSITDDTQLQEYLNNYKEKEKLRQILSQSESNNGMGSPLWAYGASPHSQLSDYTNALRKNVYQSATKDTGLETNSAEGKSDDSKTSTLCSSSVNKIWLKRNVTKEDLFQFTENLRIWMASNLLVPLVKDIDATNKALSAAAPEIQIGAVGVDKLKKTAQNITGVKQLADLIPFLDLTVHQDYLVHRLHELSAGGAISAYRWNGGSASFNGKPWKDEYPTDTAILLHLLSMYMDRQLPPDIQQPEGRTFSSTHVIKAPEKPPKPTTRPLLYLTQVNPPHLKVVLPPEEECEVGSGRNNFVHALLLFIHHVTHQQHSRIANMNLTMSGVNLTWVVRKPCKV